MSDQYVDVRLRESVVVAHETSSPTTVPPWNALPKESKTAGAGAESGITSYRSRLLPCVDNASLIRVLDSHDTVSPSTKARSARFRCVPPVSFCSALHSHVLRGTTYSYMSRNPDLGYGAPRTYTKYSSCEPSQGSRNLDLGILVESLLFRRLCITDCFITRR